MIFTILVFLGNSLGFIWFCLRVILFKTFRILNFIQIFCTLFFNLINSSVRFFDSRLSSLLSSLSVRRNLWFDGISVRFSFLSCVGSRHFRFLDLRFRHFVFYFVLFVFRNFNIFLFVGCLSSFFFIIRLLFQIIFKIFKLIFSFTFFTFFGFFVVFIFFIDRSFFFLLVRCCFFIFFVRFYLFFFLIINFIIFIFILVIMTFDISISSGSRIIIMTRFMWIWKFFKIVTIYNFPLEF